MKIETKIAEIIITIILLVYIFIIKIYNFAFGIKKKNFRKINISRILQIKKTKTQI